MTQEKGMRVSMTQLMKATVTAEAGTRVTYVRRYSETEARLWHIKNWSWQQPGGWEHRMVTKINSTHRGNPYFSPHSWVSLYKVLNCNVQNLSEDNSKTKILASPCLPLLQGLGKETGLPRHAFHPCYPSMTAETNTFAFINLWIFKKHKKTSCKFERPIQIWERQSIVLP